MDEALTFHYDEEADVLYVIVGPPRNTLNYDLTDCANAREDIDSGAVVGLTIHNCSLVYPGLLNVQPREALAEMFQLLTGMKARMQRKLEPAHLLREKANATK